MLPQFVSAVVFLAALVSGLPAVGFKTETTNLNPSSCPKAEPANGDACKHRNTVCSYTRDVHWQPRRFHSKCVNKRWKVPRRRDGYGCDPDHCPDLNNDSQCPIRLPKNGVPCPVAQRAGPGYVDLKCTYKIKAGDCYCDGSEAYLDLLSTCNDGHWRSQALLDCGFCQSRSRV